MDPLKAAAVLRRLPLRQSSYILARLQVPQAAKLMAAFSAPYRERISAVLDPSFLQVLQHVSSHGPGTVGYVMQTDIVAVRTEMKLVQLVERLKTLPRKKIPLLCVVTDKEGDFKGVIRPAEIAFYAPTSVTGSVMNTSVVLHPEDSFSRAREVFSHADAEVLPVVNDKQICVGILLRTALPAEDKKSFWKKLTD
jgi:magnesium transporter